VGKFTQSIVAIYDYPKLEPLQTNKPTTFYQ
jgi:hypothetical protein